MQQIFLTGSQASQLAAQLVRALELKPVGYVMQPFCVAGREAGQAIHLLTPPGEDTHNDLPCRVYLGEGSTAVVEEVLSSVVAPALRRSLSAQSPILLDDLDAALLHCEPFALAVRACIHSEHLVICVVREDAVALMKRMFPSPEQYWLDTSAKNALEMLQDEARMRL